MPAVREEKPASFTDIVNLVDSLQKGKETPLWFRGVWQDRLRVS